MSEFGGDGPGGHPDEGRDARGRYGRGAPGHEHGHEEAGRGQDAAARSRDGAGRGRDGAGTSWAGRGGPRVSWAGREQRGGSRAGRGHDDEQHGQHQQHGGYGTVNGASGPEYDPDRRGQESAQSGLDPDELALRRMLRGAVGGLEPSDDALDHLRRAVPARRARKRQALVGMAAAALLVGTAVPAVFHVATSPAAEDNLTSAGDSSNAPGETGTDQGPGAEAGAGQEPGEKEKDKEKEQEKEEPGTGDTASSGATAGTSPTGEVVADAPVCDASMLAQPSSSTGAAHPDGSVYGSFRVANTSTANCTVGGSGSVTFAAQGAADTSKINVVDHTAGDPAAGLPAPSAEPAAVVLAPGQSYEVQFAWVPSESCPTTNPSPDPSPTENSGDAGGTGDTESGVQTQLASGEGGTADGSVAITHTADPGAPSVEVTIPNACAGTIYRTEALPAS